MKVEARDHKIFSFLRLITPQMMQKRYDTQFFIMDATGLPNLDNLQIDQRESQSYEWNTPSAFLDQFRQQQISLFPPIFL